MRLTLKRLASLIGLVIVAWLTIVFGLFAIFRLIFEFTLSSASEFPMGVVGVLRVLLGVAVGFAWLLIWQKLASVYLWRNLKRHR